MTNDNLTNDLLLAPNNLSLSSGKLEKFLKNERPIMPGETAVVAFDNPKTAALCFDRVWDIPGPHDPVPGKIAFNYKTNVEFLIGFLHNIEKAQCERIDAIDPESFRKLLEKHASSRNSKLSLDNLQQRRSSRPQDDLDLSIILTGCIATMYLSGLSLDELSTLSISSRSAGSQMLLSGVCRKLTDALRVASGTPICPHYKAILQLDSEYKRGEYQVLLSSIGQLQIVDESKLSWEQVDDFRKDTACKAKYRRIIRWLDTEMLGMPHQQILDTIGKRLDDYHLSIAKHGLQTKVGILSTVIDEKTFFASVASLGGGLACGEQLLGGILAGGIMLGRTILSLLKSKIDLLTLNQQHRDIAFVAQIEEDLVK